MCSFSFEASAREPIGDIGIKSTKDAPGTPASAIPLRASPIFNIYEWSDSLTLIPYATLIIVAAKDNKAISELTAEYENFRCLQKAVKDRANFVSLDGFICRDNVRVQIVGESSTVSSPPCTVGQQWHVITPVHPNWYIVRRRRLYGRRTLQFQNHRHSHSIGILDGPFIEEIICPLQSIQGKK